MAKPNVNDYPNYYEPYIALVKAENIDEAINNYSKLIENFIAAIPNSKENFVYATNKWTVKDVLQHLIDAERVFVYRALRFSRKDAQPLLGFEEEAYAKNSEAKYRNFEDVKNELMLLRQSTDLFLKSLTPQQLLQTGTANNKPITVNAIGFICFGHLLHHINVLNQKYGIEA
jgi:uncharacterized damage-inducible protein DinB